MGFWTGTSGWDKQPKPKKCRNHVFDIPETSDGRYVIRECLNEGCNYSKRVRSTRAHKIGKKHTWGF